MCINQVRAAVPEVNLMSNFYLNSLWALKIFFTKNPKTQKPNPKSKPQS